MKDRPYLRSIITWALIAGATYFQYRFGVPVPPPVLPPPPIESVPVPPPTAPKPDIRKAIGRIQFGNAGCTATPVGPRGNDGRYHLVTASHCVSGVGQRGNFRAQNGSSLSVTVSALDRTSDCAWLVSDSTDLDLPFGELATATPSPGTPVWHAGYGVDKPGNVEEGTFVSGPGSDGKNKFRLSVSSGDSGGAIVNKNTGEIIAVVCCTSSMARVADVWGASPESIAALRRTVVDDWVWNPLAIPEIKGDENLP